MKLERTPKSLDLELTTECNLRCSYCSHFSSPGDTQTDLQTGEWLEFFKELKKCNVFDVCLSGGEPFLRQDIKELINALIENRMRFSMLSNGVLIDDDIASFIKSTNRCNSIQVSIDGPGPGSHDVNRGKGSFEKALEGLKTLMRHKIPATVRVTINKHNFNDLEEVSKLLLEDLGLPSFSTNSASHLGMCRDNKDETQLNADEFSACIKTLFKLEEQYNGRVNALAGPLASGRQWTKMETAKQNNEKNMAGCGCLTSCGGVFSKMAVQADGTMVPCSQLPHMKLGRINQDSLAEVWINHPDLKRLRARRDIPLDKNEFCAGCEYIPYCRGGCPALAYTLRGDENVPSPDSCYRTFLNAGGKLPEITSS